MNKILRFVYNWTSAVIDPKRIISAFPGFFWYAIDLIKYASSPGAEHIGLLDTYPVLADKTYNTLFDPHYLYQANWAFRKIKESKVKKHIDVGSDVRFATILGAITDVEFVDIRPPQIEIEGFHCRKGSIVNLPYHDDSIKSISCLHVVEHIGLGRYGDPIDPLGSSKSMKELQRVLAPGGSLYFSVPVGKPRVCFNAHRIFDPDYIVRGFSKLKLIEFAAVKDDKRFINPTTIESMKEGEYGCGMFHFKKK